MLDAWRGSCHRVSMVKAKDSHGENGHGFCFPGICLGIWASGIFKTTIGQHSLKLILSSCHLHCSQASQKHQKNVSNENVQDLFKRSETCMSIWNQRMRTFIKSLLLPNTTLCALSVLNCLITCVMRENQRCHSSSSERSHFLVRTTGYRVGSQWLMHLLSLLSNFSSNRTFLLLGALRSVGLTYMQTEWQTYLN